MTDTTFAGSQLRTGQQVMTVAAAVAVVAVSAQVAVPLPFSPVPMTLQPLAVLVVGAMLGPTRGVAALVLYLLIGALGAPVFAPGGAPGAARLIGPTGGYLLAFPVAAAIAGWSASRPGVVRLLLGLALAMVAIHVGGFAWLALLGGEASRAFEVGFVPFLTGDLLKIGLAALIVLAGSRLRPRL
jgi:biotin transport system substrate-specific component